MFTIKHSFSQNGQDNDIIEYFKYKKEGLFIDIGAYDGITYSNTYLLEKEYRWHGYCVEPQTQLYNILVKNRNCNTWKGAVSDINGRRNLYIPTNNEPNASLEIKPCICPVEVITTTLYDFLQQIKVKEEIDLLSIDVEGHEEKILSKFFKDNTSGKKQYNFNFICCETNRHLDNGTQAKKIFELLYENNYSFICNNVYDDYYKKKSI